METIKQGICKWYNKDKGFGFIESDGFDYFVHHDNLLNCKYLNENDKVEFETTIVEKNGLQGVQAVNVKAIGFRNYIIDIHMADGKRFCERYYNEHDKSIRQAITELAELIEVGYTIEILDDTDLPF